MTKIGVYILKCSNGRYYVGSTVDLDRRLEEHCEGKVKATKGVLPVVLSFFQPYEGIRTARRIEYKIKSFKSRKIIEKIIEDGVIRVS